MRKIRGCFVALATAGLVLGLAAAPASAVDPHQHEITTPSGVHDIAQGFCRGDFSSSNTQNVALANFHSMIHTGSQGPDGTVTIGAGGC